MAIRKEEAIRWLNFWALALALFVVSLQIPKVSVVMLVLVFSARIIGMRQWRIGFLWRVGLLTAFSSTYYSLLYYGAPGDLAHKTVNCMMIPLAYGIGYSLRDCSFPYGRLSVVWIFLAIISGFIIFSTLSISRHISQVGMLDTWMDRRAVGVWGGEETNAPVFGMFVSLGLCLIPTLFWGSEGIRGRHFLFITLAVFVLAACAVYVQFYARNRSPYVAFLASILSSFYVYGHSGRKKIQQKLWKFFVVSLILLTIGVFLSRLNEDILYAAVGRFETEGLETPRYQLWKQMVIHLFQYPFGGRQVYLLGQNYVHNLWLDVAYNAGIFPLTYLLLFHMSHINSFRILLRSQQPPLIVVLIFCVGVSFLCSFMVEPVLDASVSYFAMSCLFLGSVSRLSTDIGRPQWDMRTL